MRLHRPRRPILHAVLMAAVLGLTTPFAAPLHAGSVSESGPGPSATSHSSVSGPSTDSLWGMLTCGFAMSIGTRIPDLLGEAALMCAYIASLDG